MKLSVIVPIYNVEPYLRRCVDSILAQTFTDFELILVDDGSPDNCPAICDEYAAKDDRIVVIHKKNRGLSDARNAGLDVSQGEYIGFVDSDDWIAPDMYQRMIERAENDNADIVSCAISFVNDDGINKIWPNNKEEKVYSGQTLVDQYFPNLRNEIAPSACSKVYVRSIFDNVRFPIGKRYEDAFVLLDILSECEKVVLLTENYYNYFYVRPDSIINSQYSEYCLDKVEFALYYYKFFCRRKNTEQKHYALENYCMAFMREFWNIFILHHEFKPALRKYAWEFSYRLIPILANPKNCNMKRLAILMIYLNKNVSFKLWHKYFPECLPDFLRK